MTKKQISAIAIVGGIFMALGIVTGYYVHTGLNDAGPEEKSAIVKPETLPAFTLYDVEGKAVSTSELLAEDKALLINFWATWCKPCREEMPLLTEMQEKYKDRLTIVGVAIDNNEAVKKFLEHLGGVNYPILLGKQEMDAIETANAMGIDLIGLPISVTTNAKGKILDVHTGEVDASEATALIEGAIAETGEMGAER